MAIGRIIQTQIQFSIEQYLPTPKIFLNTDCMEATISYAVISYISDNPAGQNTLKELSASPEVQFMKPYLIDILKVRLYYGKIHNH